MTNSSFLFLATTGWEVTLQLCAVECRHWHHSLRTTPPWRGGMPAPPGGCLPLPCALLSGLLDRASPLQLYSCEGYPDDTNQQWGCKTAVLESSTSNSAPLERRNLTTSRRPCPEAKCSALIFFLSCASTSAPRSRSSWTCGHVRIGSTQAFGRVFIYPVNNKLHLDLDVSAALIFHSAHVPGVGPFPA
jgi:hypothetical protein